MTDVLFYQNYTVPGDVCTVIICVICWLLLGSIYTIKQRNLTVFHIANTLVCIAALSNMIYHDLIADMTYNTVFWVYMFRALTYVALILTFVQYIYYIVNFIDLKGKARQLVIALNGIGAAIFTVAEISTPFSRWIFYIDENLQIHENYYIDAFRFAYVYYMLLAAILIIGNKRKFITKMYQSIRNVMILSFGIMAIQSYFESTSVMCMTFELPILAVLFLFHYNSYDFDTGTLDVKAFDAYIKEFRNQNFSMISLRLLDTNPIKMQELSEEFYHFNEKYFKNPCTFRLNENKLVMVYDTRKNPHAKEKFPVLLEDFYALYDRFQIHYQIVFMEADESLSSGSEYLALSEHIEVRQPINTAYHCTQKDIGSFNTEMYIFREVKDIHEKCDLNDERVLVYCQPIWNRETNTYATAEVLTRLKLPELGIVFPDQFIRLAEKYEYIHTLSKIILNKACQELKRMENMGINPERISVNISVQELNDKNFCADILSIIEKNQVDYQKLAIELTESRNERDFRTMKKVIDQMHTLGIHFYLDDFGTGYSNMERILELPIDLIKFDRSLLVLAMRDKKSYDMVKSFSALFHKSGYRVLFEGIETDAEEQVCKEMDIVYLQGFKYFRPIPMEKMEEFLDKKI